MSPFPPSILKYKLSLVDAQENRLARVALWRSCALGFCAISVFLVFNLPYWQIQYQSQIEVNGNKLTSKEFVFSTLNFSYPQYIWTINGVNLAHEIESIPSIAAVRINKSIIPPKLIVSLQEKEPVAVATFAGKVGFLDISGHWIAQRFYDNMAADLALPKLKVVNYRPEYRPSWLRIYELILRYSELQVTELHWGQSSDLFLYTKIGKVFLGSDRSQLKQQFKTMLKLKKLPDYIEGSKVSYIDLSNPNLNLIQKY